MLGSQQLGDTTFSGQIRGAGLREWFVGFWHVVTENHGNFHEMWEIKPSRTDWWFQKHVFLYFSPLSITTWDNHPNFGHILDMGCVG